MTFGRKIALIITAVLVIGVVGPYLLLSIGSHSSGLHYLGHR